MYRSDTMKQNNLKLLTYQNIYGLNGSAKFVKLFQDNADFFLRHFQIHVQILSNSFMFQNELAYRNSKKFFIKKYIKKYINCFYSGSQLSIYLEYLRNARKVVNQYCQDTNEVLIFNDIFVAYYFLKKYGSNHKMVLMMHNSGDACSMLLDQHPLIKRRNAHRWLLRLTEYVFKSMTNIVFVSETARNYFISKHEDLKHKCLYIPIGIPDISISKRCTYDALHMVTVGTVCRRKNQIEIIKSIKELGDKTITLTVVGNGESYAECSDYVQSNSLEKQVFMTGSRTDIDSILSGCNLFIMASHDEGLPVSAQEALRMGLPLILTDAGGCKELIDHNGLLTSPGKIIAAIAYFNTHKYLLQSMGEKSREMFDNNYRLDLMLQRYGELAQGFFDNERSYRYRERNEI